MMQEGLQGGQNTDGIGPDIIGPHIVDTCINVLTCANPISVESLGEESPEEHRPSGRLLREVFILLTGTELGKDLAFRQGDPYTDRRNNFTRNPEL